MEGLDKLLKQFENLKNIDTIPICLAGAYELQKQAQMRAPVKTGFLRSSAFVEPTDKGAQLSWGAEYAFVVEYGSSKQPGQSFVRASIDESGNEIVQKMQDQLNKQIKEAK